MMKAWLSFSSLFPPETEVSSLFSPAIRRNADSQNTLPSFFLGKKARGVLSHSFPVPHFLLVTT